LSVQAIGRETRLDLTRLDDFDQRRRSPALFPARLIDRVPGTLERGFDTGFSALSSHARMRAARTVRSSAAARRTFVHP